MTSFRLLGTQNDKGRVLPFPLHSALGGFYSSWFPMNHLCSSCLLRVFVVRKQSDKELAASPPDAVGGKEAEEGEGDGEHLRPRAEVVDALPDAVKLGAGDLGKPVDVAHD